MMNLESKFVQFEDIGRLAQLLEHSCPTITLDPQVDVRSTMNCSCFTFDISNSLWNNVYRPVSTSPSSQYQHSATY